MLVSFANHKIVPLYILYFMDQQQYDQQEDYSDYYPEYSGDDGYEFSLQKSYSHQVQDYPFEILPLVKLYDELNHILDEIVSLVYLQRGWTLLLLAEFKWDKDYLREQIYNNMPKYLSKIGFSEHYNAPESAFHIGVCEICLSEDVKMLSNICTHSYCLECWIGHIKNNISSGSPFVRCMTDKCYAPLLHQTIFILLGEDVSEGPTLIRKYQKRLCEMFILSNKNYQFCTGIDCENCIKVNKTCLQTVTCTCGKRFCFRCQSDDHYPCNCQEKRGWAEQVIKQEADAKWISMNAKLCPSCKKAVERSVGCNFMACVCGKNFCYMCSQPWQPDHKDHFKCHIYKKRADEVVNRQKEVIAKMNHCTERYLFNQAVANNYKNIDIFAKRKYLFKVLHLELTDSEFMDAAFKFAIECCEKLKWIYAFTYYRQIEDKNMKDHFDFALGEYEKYKQNLLKMLAADLKVFMSKIEKDEIDKNLTPQKIKNYNQQFRTLKKSIVNYYTCTKSFKEKFVLQLAKLTEQLDRKKYMTEFQAITKKSEKEAKQQAEKTIQANKSEAKIKKNTKSKK